MATFVALGPGTLELGPTATASDFSCEVLSGAIAHEYEDVGEDRTMLCGTKRSATRKRIDTAKFSIENDLSAAGLYSYLMDAGEDPAPVEFTYTPNTVTAASWAGTIVPLLPGEIGADEYGAPIASDVEWPGTGLFTFTPATAAP